MKAQLANKLSINVNTGKKKTYVILVSIIAVIIIAAIAAFVAINSNKNVKDLYFQTEIKNFADLMNEIQKKRIDVENKYKPFKEKPSRSRYEISVKISDAAKDVGSNSNNSSKNNSGSFINLSRQAIEIINNAKLIYNLRYDLGKGMNMTTLSFLLAGQNIVDINTLSQDEIIGLQIPVIYDKYFVMDKNNISGALNKFGLDIPLKSIISPSQLKDAATFSEEETKNLFTDYINFLQESISNQNISMSKNVEIQELQYPSITSGNQQKSKKTGKYNIFKIQLSEEEFKPVALKTINFLCSDSRFADMTSGNITSILNLIESTGILNTVSSADSLLDEIKNYSDMEKLKSILTDFINNTAFPDGFNMTLITDLKGNIVDRKIDFSSQGQDEPVRKYNIHAGSFFTKVTIEQGSSEDSSNNALIEFEKVRKNTEGDAYMHIYCVNNIWPDFDLTINLDKESSEDNKRKAINTNYLIDINLSADALGLYNANILLDVKGEERYDVEFSMPDLNNETAVNLSTLSKEEIDALMMELQFSAAKFLLGNQSIINAFTSK
ncbi:MAG TPA: hypothetical protein GXX37_09835 [Clostridiaceae bacterium]|nr:hypothetical protein [Clostridiaceae bacterium]